MTGKRESASAPVPNSLKRRFAQSFASLFIQGLQPFLLTIIVANTLAPSDLAMYRYVLITGAFAAVAVNPGLSVYASHIFARADSRPDERADPLAFTWILSIGLSLTLPVALLFLPQGAFSISDRVPLTILALYVCASGLRAVPYGALLGYRRNGRVLRADTAGFVLAAIATLFATSATGALGALVVAAFAVAILQTIDLFRSLDRDRLRANLRVVGGWPAAQRVVSGTLPLGISGFAQAGAVWAVSDIVLRSHPDALVFAAFSIGLQWYAIATIFARVAVNVLIPEASRAVSEGDPDALKSNGRRLRKSVAAISALAFAGSGFAWMIGDLLILLYGSDYTDFGQVPATYLIAALPFAVMNVLGIQLIAVDAQRAWMGASLVQAFVSVAVTWFVAAAGVYAGAIGLATGGCAGVIVILFYLVQNVRKH